MATIWDISSFHDLTNINSGYQFADGDIIQAEHINDALENTGWLKEKVEEIETNIASNYKLYNHEISINLIINDSMSNRIQYFVYIHLQDNSNVAYTKNTLQSELYRIHATSRGSYLDSCAFLYNHDNTADFGIGMLRVDSSRLRLYSTAGTLLFDSSTDYGWGGVSDTITLARQNS